MIRKPELGRPADRRLTAEAIAADPRLTGVEPFDPGQDIDVLDEINAALGDFDTRVDAVESSSGGPIYLSTPTGTVLDYTPPGTMQAAGPSAGIYGQLLRVGPNALSVTAGAISVAPGQRTGQLGVLARLDADRVIQEVWHSTSGLHFTGSGLFEFAFGAEIVLLPGTLYVLGLDAAGNGNTARETMMEAVWRDYTNGSITLLDWARSNTANVGASASTLNTHWQHQVQLTYASASTTKNVTGPLDPLDSPVITAVSQLPNNSAAILDTGSAPPRLVRRRSDGSVWYGPPFSATP